MEDTKKRAEKVFENGNSQSNGCLMRASPLCAVSLSDAIADCNLTNPNPVCNEAVKIYWKILDKILKGTFDPNSTNIKVTEPALERVVKNALRGKEMNVNEPGTKGWVGNGLHCALYEVYHTDSYVEAMEHVIRRDGDTDTNACITGKL